jgi:hypothetical protein
MSDVRPRLEIFVLGGRLGESTIIRTPRGQFGVIDAYAETPDDPDSNPTILRLRALKAKALSFIALTHPHADHFRGLVSLFREYSGSISQYWRPIRGPKDWEAIGEQIYEEADSEEEFDEDAKDLVESFGALMDAATYEAKENGMRPVTTLDETELLREEEHDFSIRCLGPSTAVMDRYLDSPTRKLVSGIHTFNAHHNLISSVLAVEYGDWIGIFGGDTEESSWNDVLERCGSTCVSRARFIKVPHHGSITGSYQAFWNGITSRSCDAVVTCFARHKLPSAEGIRPIRERGYTIHSTNRDLARRLTFDQLIMSPPPDIGMLARLTAKHSLGEVHVVVDPMGSSSITYIGRANRLN